MTLQLHRAAPSCGDTKHSTHAALRADVIAGLSRTPKTLPCKYFYDDEGSRLFARICETPEYYPTRTEIGILRAHATDIAAAMGPDAYLVELGSGPDTKIRIVLAAADLAAYIPVDISGQYLAQTAARIARDYPTLDVMPVCADFTSTFTLPYHRGAGRVVGFFPGSTIGNFAPAEAAALLRRFAEVLGSGSGLLVGVDLKKDVRILHAAYNDAAGVTAAFNLNILKRLNRELGADFDLKAFAHRAVYNVAEGRIEMYLDSLAAQTVHIGTAAVRFAKGESIGTEHSYKFDVAGFKALAARAGYACRTAWHDPQRYFGVFYLTLDH